MKRLIFDLEGNGLLPELTKLHVLSATDVDTGEVVGTWGPDQISQGLEKLEQADKLIAHFGIGYDFPALAKVKGFIVPESKQLDTVVLSRLKHPNIKETDSKFNASQMAKGLPTMGDSFGKHTIEAWGIRLGIPKLHTDITDWSEWTQEMQDRCAGDVATALRLWKNLNPDRMSQPAIELEHRIARVCRKITEAGWPFDEKKAVELHAKLVDEKHLLEVELKKQFGGWVIETPFVPKVNNKARGYVKGQTFIKKETIEFNPRSTQHIEKVMRELGWVPTEFTDGGRAKLDEPILENIVSEYPQAQGLTRYLMLGKRIGQLADGKNAWLKHVGKDGRIHADYNPIGAITFRASHYSPNIAQVPAASSEYGHECRELFTVPEGWEEVGADMSGLEGRCFAHYLARYDNGAYGEALLKGDPHWAVVLAVGYLDCVRDKDSQLHIVIREQGAKRLFYGMLYGAGDEKAGRIVLEACRLARKTTGNEAIYKKFFGEDEAPNSRTLKVVGAAAKKAVITGIGGFEQLKDVISAKVKSEGWLPGLDGRRLPIRSDHAALNSLLQSAGAILCKQWVCDGYDALINDGLKYGWDGDFVFLGWIHDELQIACRNGLGDRIGKLLTDAARKAGDPFKFRIALDSDYKIGKSWADTH